MNFWLVRISKCSKTQLLINNQKKTVTYAVLKFSRNETNEVPALDFSRHCIDKL